MAGPNTILNRQHRDRLNRAIRKVLDTELALETYSQIVDGLPLASVAYDQDGPRREGSHPISRHTSLCPGARETARDFLSEFADIDTLAFDAEVRTCVDNNYQHPRIRILKTCPYPVTTSVPVHSARTSQL
jgi:hypothetical protein